MQYAVIARCPVFGGKVASFDASKAKAVPVVKTVVQISNGVAVLADWNAMEGRRALPFNGIRFAFRIWCDCALAPRRRGVRRLAM